MCVVCVLCMLTLCVCLVSVEKSWYDTLYTARMRHFPHLRVARDVLLPRVALEWGVRLRRLKHQVTDADIKSFHAHLLAAHRDPSNMRAA